MGGRAFNGVIDTVSVNQTQAVSLKQWTIRFLTSSLGIQSDYIVEIGTAGKKANKADLSGDIDVGVSYKALGNSMEDAYENLARRLSVEAFNIPQVPNKGLKLVSLAVPIPNDKDNKAQIDLLVVGSPRWAKFGFYCPSPLESKYKSAHRNWIIAAIIGAMDFNVVRNEDGHMIECNSYSYDWNSGVRLVHKNYIGKSGKLVKTPTKTTLDTITEEPRKLIEMVVGPGYSEADVSTFERIWQIVSSESFIHKDYLKDIIADFKRFLKRTNLEVPSELN